MCSRRHFVKVLQGNNMANSVEHKVVLVTGGARGLGAAFVRTFMEEKAKFVAILDVNEEHGIKLENELNEKYPLSKAKFIKCDVSDDYQLKNAYKKVIDEAGYIDIVINNAGVIIETAENFKRCIDINVTGVLNSSMIAFKKMRKDNGGLGGTIINIASGSALVNLTFLPIYSSTKSAVLQFSICLGSEPHYSRTGVRVMAICFGSTDTAIIDTAKITAIDDETLIEVKYYFDSSYYKQKVESAASALIYAYKNGRSASTWLSVNDNPVLDITENVKEGYSILGRGTFPSSQ